jgi:hypothetical protein
MREYRRSDRRGNRSAGFGLLVVVAATILFVLLRRSYLDAGRRRSRKRGFELLPKSGETDSAR